MQTESQLKPIETCPKGHRYNTIKYGDTCPVCGSKIANAPKTEDEWKKEIELPPEQWACGILVCIRGLNKGRGYLIHEGKNYIGSDPNSDICIRGDDKIQPRRHLVILYEPRSRKTMLLPAESRGMIYMERQAVYERRDLQHQDQFVIGTSTLLFLEICSENFGWDDLQAGD